MTGDQLRSAAADRRSLVRWPVARRKTVAKYREEANQFHSIGFESRACATGAWGRAAPKSRVSLQIEPGFAYANGSTRRCSGVAEIRGKGLFAQHVLACCRGGLRKNPMTMISCSHGLN